MYLAKQCCVLFQWRTRLTVTLWSCAQCSFPPTCRTWRKWLKISTMKTSVLSAYPRCRFVCWFYLAFHSDVVLLSVVVSFCVLFMLCWCWTKDSSSFEVQFCKSVCNIFSFISSSFVKLLKWASVTHFLPRPSKLLNPLSQFPIFYCCQCRVIYTLHHRQEIFVLPLKEFWILSVRNKPTNFVAWTVFVF